VPGLAAYTGRVAPSMRRARDHRRQGNPPVAPAILERLTLDLLSYGVHYLEKGGDGGPVKRVYQLKCELRDHRRLDACLSRPETAAALTW